MSVTCEVTAAFLELDAGITPPCDAWRIQALSIRCGAPSAVRVFISCACGESGAYFLCSCDFGKLKRHKAQCGFCQTPITQWREV